MRRSILACAVVLGPGAMGLLAAIPEASAQEPLLLRIRPPGEAPRDLGTGSGPMTDDAVRQARARNEAVWERAERRARIAIASVCTGCLTPPRPAAERPSPVAVEPAPAMLLPSGTPLPSATPLPVVMPLPFAQTGAP